MLQVVPPPEQGNQTFFLGKVRPKGVVTVRLCCLAVVEAGARIPDSVPRGLFPLPGPPHRPVCASLIGLLSHCCSQPEFALLFGPVACSHHAPHCSLNLLECDFFSLASLPDAEIDVYFLVLHPVPQGKTEMMGCVSGPLRAGSMEGHTGHQKAGQIRGGEESRIGRGCCQLFWRFQIKTLRSRGIAFRMLIKLNLMGWEE